MQNTRLSTLINFSINNIRQWFLNPWRRISLSLISFFFGFFLGSAISTSLGQQAQIDVIGAAVILLVVEIISRIAYRSNQTPPILWIETLNSCKIGFVYSLYLEALKLGS